MIELIVVLIIIGCLATISLPLYSQYLHKMHRLSAIQVVLQTAQNLEQYYFEHSTYQHATLEKLKIPLDAIKSYYALQLILANNQYIIKAVPIHQQAIQDAGCGSLLLTSEGIKQVSGPADVTSC